jgi:hypothetical protein
MERKHRMEARVKEILRMAPKKKVCISTIEK